MDTLAAQSGSHLSQWRKSLSLLESHQAALLAFAASEKLSFQSRL